MDQWWQRERMPAGDETSGPLVLVDVTPPNRGAEEEISANDGQPPLGGRRLWRRVAEPLLLLAVLAAAFAATRLADDRQPTGPDGASTPVASGSPASARPVAAPSMAPANTRRSPAASPRFVVPTTAHPGERITIVGYRDGRLCGLTMLHFDGIPISNQVLASATHPTGGWVELYLSVTIPSAARLGSHGLELFGPVRDGRAGVFCGDAPEHEDRLADAELIVIP